MNLNQGTSYSSMKVAVCMFYDDAIKSYADITAKINKAYCDKHGFDFIVSHEKTYSKRHASYEKIPLLLKYIESYDYVIWIDADAFFYIDTLNITEIINIYPDTHFIFSRDIPPTFYNTINCGIFIVKNTSYSIEFMKKWAYDQELYDNNPVPGWWEQGILHLMERQNIMDINEKSVKCDYGLLQHYYRHELNLFSKQPLVFHMTKNKKEDRELLAEKYYEFSGL